MQALYSIPIDGSMNDEGDQKNATNCLYIKMSYAKFHNIVLQISHTLVLPRAKRQTSSNEAKIIVRHILIKT